jgi:hypothetical protein
MVETIGTLVAGSEVIPTIGKAYLVLVEQVKIDTDVSADAREGYPMGFVVL